MNTCKLIFRNVCKNIRDYLIYFLTLTLSVSLFYAFNSISDQPAFSNMGMTGTPLYRQLGIMLSTLSTMIAVVLAFLILYANQFLLKRRKKELGVYMMLGMKKGRISRLFAGETLCVGIIALGTGLLLGFLQSILKSFESCFQPERFARPCCVSQSSFLLSCFSIFGLSPMLN